MKPIIITKPTINTPSPIFYYINGGFVSGKPDAQKKKKYKSFQRN
jgi:hypothetical protein